MDINSAAMTVILHAGNAREYIDESLDLMASFEFQAAEKSLELADLEIVKAHNGQTEIIQQQAAGEDMEYSLLFIHAQDTMMTINTELHLTRKMLPIFQTLFSQVKGEKV